MSLFLRNLVFTILQPGLVAGLVPLLIAWASGADLLPAATTPLRVAGLIIAAIGVVITALCIIRFAREGRGTLSPLDPTKRLVTGGLYRYSRNPMYVGVMLILLGQGVFWQSAAIALYAAVVFTAFNLFIIFHEEPRLKRDFGKEYEAYIKRTGRWV
jgi:protein-S-isoprenylcysteine O-methyltransferase Ste14